MAGQFYGTRTPPSSKRSSQSTPVRNGSKGKSPGVPQLQNRSLQPTALELFDKSGSQTTAACDESSSLAEVIRISQVHDKAIQALRTMVEDQNTKIASLTTAVEDMGKMMESHIVPKKTERSKAVPKDLLVSCSSHTHNVILLLLSNQTRTK